MKRNLSLTILGLLFILLLIFPKETFDSSKTGLLLWFDTLLPTLLPFLIISQLILKTSLVESTQRLIGPLFRAIFHCSENGFFCLFCGFLCGYPVGARLISLQMKEKRLSLSEGQYLLSFCNNVSPMFCISYGIINSIGTHRILPFLVIIYGSAILLGLFMRPKEPYPNITNAKKQTSSAESIFQLIDVCIIDSFLIMIKLCGYLILFTIISNFTNMLLPDNFSYATSIVASLLEITGGLLAVQQLPYGMIRSAISIFALTFGGICCILQTNAVITDTGLSLKKYIYHKAITAAIALCLFFLWCLFVNRFSINGWR